MPTMAESTFSLLNSTPSISPEESAVYARIAISSGAAPSSMNGTPVWEFPVEHQHRATVRDDEVRRVVAQMNTHGDRNTAGENDAEARLHPPHPGGDANGHTVTDLDASRLQPACDPRRLGPQLREGDLLAVDLLHRDA